jgi:hypothetical protein
MGLLDFNMPGMDTPEGQGLLSAAFSLMQAKKLPGQKGAFAGALGDAGQQYLQTSNTATDQMQRRKYLDAQMQAQQMQLEAARQAQAEKQRQEAALRAAFGPMGASQALSGGGGPTNENAARIGQLPKFDPRQLLADGGVGALEQGLKINSALNPAPKYETLAPGSSMFKMGPNGPELAMTAPAAPDKPTAGIQEYQFAKEQGYPGTFQQYKMDMAKAGATNVSNSVSVAGPENKYNQVIGEGLAKDSLATVEIAQAAPEVVANAQMIRKAIQGGAITGTGAGARYTLQKAMETAGLVGPGKAANTQALMAGLGKLTLSGIKTSGLGGGNGFTDKDRAFLQSAVSGEIDSTPENLLRVADMSERIARANHKKGLDITSRWKGNAALGPVVQDTQIAPIPESSASPAPSQAMPTLPPAQQHKGRVIRDTATGKMLKSNGMSWVEVK